jgi:hypothetical protein
MRWPWFLGLLTPGPVPPPREYRITSLSSIIPFHLVRKVQGRVAPPKMQWGSRNLSRSPISFPLAAAGVCRRGWDKRNNKRKNERSQGAPPMAASIPCPGLPLLQTERSDQGAVRYDGVHGLSARVIDSGLIMYSSCTRPTSPRPGQSLRGTCFVLLFSFPRDPRLRHRSRALAKSSKGTSGRNQQQSGQACQSPLQVIPETRSWGRVSCLRAGPRGMPCGTRTSGCRASSTKAGRQDRVSDNTRTYMTAMHAVSDIGRLVWASVSPPHSPTSSFDSVGKGCHGRNTGPSWGRAPSGSGRLLLSLDSARPREAKEGRAGGQAGKAGMWTGGKQPSCLEMLAPPTIKASQPDC